MNKNENNVLSTEMGKRSVYDRCINRAANVYNGTRENSVGKYSGQVDNVDTANKTADYYLDAELIAVRPGNIYNPDLTIFKSYKTGDRVGTIFSWRLINNKLYWVIPSGKLVEGFGQAFDGKIAAATSSGFKRELRQRELDKLMEKNEINFSPGKLFEGFGKNFGLITGVVVVVVVLVAFSQLKKAL